MRHTPHDALTQALHRCAIVPERIDHRSACPLPVLPLSAARHAVLPELWRVDRRGHRGHRRRNCLRIRRESGHMGAARKARPHHRRQLGGQRTRRPQRAAARCDCYKRVSSPLTLVFECIAM